LVSLSVGARRITVQSVDSKGSVAAASVNVTVN